MKKSKILIIEDELLIAMTTKLALSNLGYEVCGIAPEGEIAIKMAKEEQPDLVITDIMLNGKLDGFETAKRIREFCSIPIIFMTGYQEEEMQKGSELIDNSAFFEKPVDRKKLFETVKRLLNG